MIEENGESFSCFLPSIKIDPESGCSTPLMIFMRVDFPQPFHETGIRVAEEVRTSFDQTEHECIDP
jgi:hypothetical protein